MGGPEAHEKVKRVLSILLGVMVVLLAVILIALIICLFTDGMAGRFGFREDGTPVIYTREIVRERLLAPALVRVPATLTAVLLVIVLVTRILWPAKQKATGNFRFRGVAVSEKAVRIARICLVLLAVGLIAAGILNGGAEETLIKAINLCTECLGLG